MRDDRHEDREARRRGMPNLAARILTAAVAVPLLLALLFWAPPWGFLVLLVAVAAVGALELTAMTLDGDMVLRGVAMVSTIGVLLVVRMASDARLPLTGLAVLVAGGLVAALLRAQPIENAARHAAWLIAGPAYIGGLLGMLALLHARESGGSWVLLCLMIAWLGDTGGYFAGRFLGKRRLYERVSPKKTIEGALGGLAASAAGAAIAHYWYLPGLQLLEGLALAIVAGALGQAGDLSESLIKRSTGVKDSGSIVPGHGGILDRIDALLFVSAAVWVYAAWA